MENNNLNLLGNKLNQTGKKEKIIVIVLAVIFLIVVFGAFWDLYGKKLLCNCNQQETILNNDLQSTSTPTITTTPGNQIMESNKPVNPTSSVKPIASIKPISSVKPPATTNNNVAYSTYSQCIENTKDLPASKDCCDCLSGDASVHKACRDAAATYDFSKNTVFKTFEIPSTLGQKGDYSTCTVSGNQQQCKQCCENSGKFVCGDFRFCRTACDGLSQ